MLVEDMVQGIEKLNDKEAYTFMVSIPKDALIEVAEYMKVEDRGERGYIAKAVIAKMMSHEYKYKCDLHIRIRGVEPVYMYAIYCRTFPYDIGSYTNTDEGETMVLSERTFENKAEALHEAENHVRKIMRGMASSRLYYNTEGIDETQKENETLDRR